MKFSQIPKVNGYGTFLLRFYNLKRVCFFEKMEQTPAAELFAAGVCFLKESLCV